MESEKLDRVVLERRRYTDWRGRAEMWRSVSAGLAILALVVSFLLIQSLRNNDILRYSNKGLISALDGKVNTIERR